MILSAIAVLLTFGLVIFIHEFGHYLVCVALRVRVERFAFGFGPELIGFERWGTRFSVCALPLGGFVKPAGESLDEASGRPDEYFSKPWYQRLLIVWAGPVMNYVLAWFLFTGLVYTKGIPEPSDSTQIGDVFIDFPAYAAGIRPDDVILSVDGDAMTGWKQLAERINKNPERELTIRFQRGEQLRTVKVTPRLDAANNRGLIGIAPTAEVKPLGLWASMQEGLRQDWYWTAYTVKELSRKIYRRETPDMAGPIGIIGLVSKAAHSGAADLVFLIALISVAIGFFNFLPVPLLDGGHAAMYLWEGLTRKPLTEKVMTYANTIGIAFLLSVLIFATWQDILRLRKPAPKEQDTSVAVSTGTVTVPAIPSK